MHLSPVRLRLLVVVVMVTTIRLKRGGVHWCRRGGGELMRLRLRLRVLHGMDVVGQRLEAQVIVGGQMVIVGGRYTALVGVVVGG